MTGTTGSDSPVAVVGSGLAGLVTALMLAPRPVVLLTRSAAGAETSSAWAQGGIAASLGIDDHPDLHLADTLSAGDGLCDKEAASSIVNDAPAVITMLETFGVRFDRTKDDTAYLLGLEAAHGRKRIVHADGDGTGAAIIRVLVNAVRNTPSVTVMEGVEVRRLILDDGKVAGLLCATANGPLRIQTSRVVLATGGLGGLYQATTNPVGNFGQGIMLAARAGAELADMEFVQFHPTALDFPRQPLALVSEAVRGEGAILVNDRGERFLHTLPGAELAPRDMVARAIGAEIISGRRVFLDARRIRGPGFEKRFPAIAGLCDSAGINPQLECIPVKPAVHYHMGGVATDLRARSSVDGLWVVGEAASTGLHGANRLASNSLLEAAVMGMRAAQDIAGVPGQTARALPAMELPRPADVSDIRAITSRYLGMLRNSGGLGCAIALLLPHIREGRASSDPALVALAIAVFASRREESRGAHARTDFPLKSPLAMRQKMTLEAIIAHARSMIAPAAAEITMEYAL